ncbi:RNA polymerase sigma factor [Aestuariibaculum sp. TT11]|uniref:RNA polymerase sigma factor n=1 Tax=Aestuariibaculum sediminum TaxID=2770637 RepID=A0A8J6QBD9_9FLAO|nr:RNA polymerase sigma factor [Aestuariibaculum sediminum]
MKVIQLHKNEATLIQRAIKHNREAQQLLYAQYAPKMLSVCRYYISDLQYAEDVMLRGFFKVFAHLKSFKGEGSFEGWIRKIMVRESINYLRKQKLVEFAIEDVEIKTEISDDTLEVGIEVEQLQQLIDELPEGYKMVFIMYAIEGYKHQEIATLLKISVSTSKSQLFKARKLLQERIKHLNKTSYGTN